MKPITDTNTASRALPLGVAQDELRLTEARKRAFVYLHDTREQKPVVFLDKMVANFDRPFLATLDASDDIQMILACAVEAVVVVKESLKAPETASGIIALAEVDLLN